MYIDANKCVSCQKCVPYCPMECIVKGEKAMTINLDECVECGICLRNANCPTKAIYNVFLTMPRAARKAFSDPFGKHENTELKHMGRGTEEIKTNDVTGIIHSLDQVAVAIEMGRPSVGAYFRDAEKITKVVSAFDIEFEKNNPVTSYIIDKKTGAIEPSILNEKVLSCIVEFRTDAANLEPILAALKTAADYVDTVFSVAVICKIDENNNSLVEKYLTTQGYQIRQASSKTNVGLGRPRYEDRMKEAR
ncbi:MAG TPA: 4Fe-4S binding protein [Selenomonadales bacterium]|nr:4Fe-4S binding protein [Selenomonadales bacterium]